MGAAWEVAMEGRDVSDSLRKVLPCGSSGSALVWIGDMNDFGTNYTDVRGSACDFPAAGHMKTGNAAEG